MRRFLSYYRQFDELSPDEVSRELRERRDDERRRDPAQQPPLDLSGAAWHLPPHPEIVNAATFALRRAVNAYPDRGRRCGRRSPRRTTSTRRGSSSATARASCCAPRCARWLPRRGRRRLARLGARCRSS